MIEEYATKIGQSMTGRTNAPRLADSVKRETAIQDTKISVCSDCYWGIFPHHERKWTSRGLVHVKCEHERPQCETKNVKGALSQ